MRGGLELSGRANRRPIKLQRSQAYSVLYYKDSALSSEIRNLHEQYVSGHPDTVLRYQHLFTSRPDPEVSPTADEVPPATEDTFPAPEEPPSTDGPTAQTFPTPESVPFVHFQQTLIREKIDTMTTEEAAAVDRYIDEQHAAAMVAWARPWLTTSKASKLPKELVTSGEPGVCEEQLEMQYYQQ